MFDFIISISFDRISLELAEVNIDEVLDKFEKVWKPTQSDDR